MPEYTNDYGQESEPLKKHTAESDPQSFKQPGRQPVASLVRNQLVLTQYCKHYLQQSRPSCREPYSLFAPLEDVRALQWLSIKSTEGVENEHTEQTVCVLKAEEKEPSSDKVKNHLTGS